MRALVLVLAVTACSKSDAPPETQPAPHIAPVTDDRKAVLHAPLAADEGTITVDAPTAQVGKPSIAHVTVKPGAGYHINERYPVKLWLATSAGLELPKSTLTRDDGTLDERRLAIDVPFTATKSGDLVIGATLDLGVCRDTACLTRTTPIAISVAAR